MSRIKINNFGPLKEGCTDNDGWIEISKLTVFIGNQGSGKSTIAKLISTFTWIEKALVRGDHTIEYFTKEGVFEYPFLSYHRIENYLQPNSHIIYEGEAYTIQYQNGVLSIDEISQDRYALPQIMYVPAERNFISYVNSVLTLKLSSEALSEFLTEYLNAADKIPPVFPLPINNVILKNSKDSQLFEVIGKDYKVHLAEASSGFQSLVPLYLVSWFLADSVKNNKSDLNYKQREQFLAETRKISEDPNLTEDMKRMLISEKAKKFNKTAFINIVEEPEQNLFPESQWSMLQSLLKLNNERLDSKLIVTTHSPYLVSYINIAIFANTIKNKISNDRELVEKLSAIIDPATTMDAQDVVIYQLDENSGCASKLSTFEGIISDSNYLNDSLKRGNQRFDELIEIEEEYEHKLS